MAGLEVRVEICIDAISSLNRTKSWSPELIIENFKRLRSNSQFDTLAKILPCGEKETVKTLLKAFQIKTNQLVVLKFVKCVWILSINSDWLNSFPCERLYLFLLKCRIMRDSDTYVSEVIRMKWVNVFEAFWKRAFRLEWHKYYLFNNDFCQLQIDFNYNNGSDFPREIFS